MRFVPNHRVSYHGVFYKADDVIEIDASDAEEMSQHGTVESSSELATHESPELDHEFANNTSTLEKPVIKRGRPRKV